jgi:hypothetical protein
MRGSASCHRPRPSRNSSVRADKNALLSLELDNLTGKTNRLVHEACCDMQDKSVVSFSASEKTCKFNRGWLSETVNNLYIGWAQPCA